MDNLSVFENSANGFEKVTGKFFDPAIFVLLRCIGLNFYRFLKSLGMSGERNLVILSSRDNYSCGENELKNARILINLKSLNLIKHLDLFLNSLVRVLPPGTNFIGCFYDRKKKGQGLFNKCITVRLGSRSGVFFSRPGRHVMNRSDVVELLEKNGFRTLEMKDLNGLTYFRSQNICQPA